MKPIIKAMCALLVVVLSLGCVSLTAFAQEDREVLDKNLVKLPAEIMKSESLDNFTDIIVCEDDNCFYTVSDDVLYKYDFLTGEYEKIEAYKYDYDMDVNSRYVANEKVYILLCDNSWSDYRPCCSLVLCFDIKTETMTKVAEYSYELLDAVGADDLGRIYLAGETVGKADDKGEFIRIIDSQGNMLNEISVEDEVFDFFGFDEERGYFFTNSYYNYYSWGYDHAMNAVRVGSINENNEIFYDSDIVMEVSQRYFYDRLKSVEVLGNDYLAIDAIMDGMLQVIPLDSFDPESGKMGIALSVGRGVEEEEFDNLRTLGTRCIYLEDEGALIFSTDDKRVMCFNPASGEVAGEFNIQHNAYAMYDFGGKLLLFEKEGEEFYYCFIELKSVENIFATPDEVTLQVGETAKVKATVDGTYTPDFVWESENPYVATVTNEGTIVGWKEGSTSIKVSAKNLPTVYIKVTVTANASYDEAPLSVNESLKNRIFNEGQNNYNVWATTVKTYLNENQDGTFTAVYAGEDKVFVDTYSSDFSTCIKSVELEYPMELFGGYFSGEKYNYLVFGDVNENESDDKEVIRVQKYSKNFELIDSLSLYGENTHIPFDGGSLSMIEADGHLYVHTCHEMYADEAGDHHQANMSFVVNTEDFVLEQIYSDVGFVSQSGYISHSFNQLIASDDEYIYRIDHGDAAPRGVSILKTAIGEDITEVKYAVPVSFEGGYGQNYTGASIGGVECSTEKVLVAGNIYSDPENMWYCTRNVFLSVTNKGLYNPNTVTITDYDEYGDISALTPHLVKLNDEQFLVMWEEYNEAEYTFKTKAVLVNSDGVVASEIEEIPYRLSDCKPVFASDYTVKWIVSDMKKTILCSINPFKLDEIKIVVEEEPTTPTEGNSEFPTQPEPPTYPTQPDASEITTSATEPSTQGGTDISENKDILGDVNSDSKVNIKDATLIQKAAAKVTELTDEENLRANVNGDTKVNIKDATAIQKFVAKIETGYPISKPIF